MADLAVARFCQEREIQISGGRCFSGNFWRQAILYYLFGIWADREEVTYRPKISFSFWDKGNIGDTSLHYLLRLGSSSSRYFAYWLGSGSAQPSNKHSLFDSRRTLIVGNQQTEVEQALIRFVKNERIRLLAITLPNHRCLYLCKGEERGQLLVNGNIPHLDEE